MKEIYEDYCCFISKSSIVYHLTLIIYIEGLQDFGLFRGEQWGDII